MWDQKGIPELLFTTGMKAPDRCDYFKKCRDISHTEQAISFSGAIWANKNSCNFIKVFFLEEPITIIGFTLAQIFTFHSATNP